MLSLAYTMIGTVGSGIRVYGTGIPYVSATRLPPPRAAPHPPFLMTVRLFLDNWWRAARLASNYFTRTIMTYIAAPR